VPWSVWHLILLNAFYIRAAVIDQLLCGTSKVTASQYLNCMATSKSVLLQ